MTDTRDEGRTLLKEAASYIARYAGNDGYAAEIVVDINSYLRADPSDEVGEEIEDMRARKDAAYTERNRCVVAMAHMARALGWTVYASEHDPEDTEWEGDWRAILVVESPEGQLTWHFHDSHRAMLEGFDLRLYEWDGHDTPEKYRRLEESLARLRRIPEDRPRIVCLCGSTRFSQAWIDATRERSLAGEIVLSVGVMIHAGAEPIRDDSPEKQALDDLHLRKIDLADYVLVLNVDGYIGDSTRREIKYADAMGKRVEYLEPLSTPEKSERDD